MESPQVPEPTRPPALPPAAPRTPWQQKLAKIKEQNVEAKASLAEAVARRRAFAHLDEFGLKPEQFGAMLKAASEAYVDGGFFLRTLGLFYEVSPELSLTAHDLRQEWIRQYDLKTVPELMLLDQAMLAYLHMVRVSKQVADTLALTESEFFIADGLHVKIKKEGRLNNEFDGFVVEDAVEKLRERLMPLVERFNQMFLRNLRALRELKANPISINIRRADQVNVAHQQVNVHGEGTDPGVSQK